MEEVIINITEEVEEVTINVLEGGAIDIDDTVTEMSQNAVKSSGIWTAINNLWQSFSGALSNVSDSISNHINAQNDAHPAKAITVSDQVTPDYTTPEMGDTLQDITNKVAWLSEINSDYTFRHNTENASTLLDGEGNVNVLKQIIDLFQAAVIDDITGEVVYYLSKDTPTLQSDGITPSVLTGEDGSVMIIKPEFWVKSWMEGSVEYTSLSLYEKDGYRLSPKFAYGKYKAYLDENGRLVSRSGVYCTTSRNLPEFRTYARNGRNHLWNVTPYHMYNDLVLLYKAVVRNLDSQSALGYVSRASSTDWNNYNGYYPVWQTGVMNDKPTLYTGSKQVVVPSFVGGSTDLVTEVVSFMGIEDFYGHIFELLDGALIHYDAELNGSIYLAENASNFANDGDAEGNPPEGYGYLGSAPASGGYITQTIMGHFLPSKTGGSSSTHYCDYHYESTTAGWRVPRMGGRLFSGAFAGCFCSWFAHSALYRYSAFGARLGLYL
jgi:hypothetical protein